MIGTLSLNLINHTHYTPLAPVSLISYFSNFPIPICPSKYTFQVFLALHLLSIVSSSFFCDVPPGQFGFQVKPSKHSKNSSTEGRCNPTSQPHNLTTPHIFTTSRNKLLLEKAQYSKIVDHSSQGIWKNSQPPSTSLVKPPIFSTKMPTSSYLR